MESYLNVYYFIINSGIWTASSLIGWLNQKNTVNLECFDCHVLISSYTAFWNRPAVQCWGWMWVDCWWRLVLHVWLANVLWKRDGGGRRTTSGVKRRSGVFIILSPFLKHSNVSIQSIISTVTQNQAICCRHTYAYSSGYAIFKTQNRASPTIARTHIHKMAFNMI